MNDVRHPRVSILIVNFNGADLLKDCLRSLNSVSFPSFEIIVVDNASTDDSLEVLAAFPHVTVLKSNRNLGFAGGNNLGLPLCRADCVLLLNSDTIVSPDFLRPLWDYLDKHPKVAIVQAKMILSRHAGKLDVCGSFLTRFGFLYHYGYWKEDGPHYERSYPIFSAKGACLMFRKALVNHTGGYLFNDNFFCYYEETDFCHRAWLAGYETHFVHTSKIHHLQGATADRTQKSGFALRHFLTNQTFSLLANLSVPSLLRIMPAYFAIFLSSMALAGLTFKRVIFGAHVHALVACVRNLKKIQVQRGMIRQIRMVDDQTIFTKVMKTPRFAYFVKTFTGRLSRYRDDA